MREQTKKQEGCGSRFQPFIFFIVLAETTDKNLNIKTLTTTTFTTETGTKGTKNPLIAISKGPTTHELAEPTSHDASFLFFSFFCVQSLSCIPFLKFSCFFFNSARTSHRSTASQDGQYTQLFKEHNQTRDRHKGDIIIIMVIVIVTHYGATKDSDGAG